METNIKTYKTTDYSIFKTISGNRTVNLKNVNDIINNIRKNGLLHTIIVVNENMEVIDGQHRLEAFKELNLPVYYQIVDGLTLKDCVAYNVSGKKWGAIDYIESYAELGYYDYQILLKFISEYTSIGAMTIAGITNGKVYGANTTKIVNGEYKLNGNVYELTQKLDYVSKINDILPDCIGYKSRLLGVVGNLYTMDKIDTDRLYEQLEKYSYMIDEIVGKRDSLQKVEEIYNYKKRQKVYFVSDYREMFK